MKPRYPFALALLFLAVAVIGLRFNASRATELKNNIVAKDLAGTSVRQEINQLREFVFSHMNSSVSFELTGSYERAVVGSQQADITGDVYDRAQAVCDREGVSSVEQAQCVQDYLSGRVRSTNGQPPPPKSQYTYSFASPGWSPDLAGLGLLAALVFFVWGLVLYIKAQFRSRQL